VVPQRRSPGKPGVPAFPPLSDAELAEFLRELAASLPDDLAGQVTAGLERGDPPATVARRVRDELRRRGDLPRNPTGGP
jgi:hypothetical protein